MGQGDNRATQAPGINPLAQVVSAFPAAHRVVNTPFKPDQVRPCFVQYSLNLNTNGGGFGGSDTTIELLVDELLVPVTVVAHYRLQLNSGGLTWIEDVPVCAMVPPNFNVIIRVVIGAGTPATVTLVNCTEVHL